MHDRPRRIAPPEPATRTYDSNQLQHLLTCKPPTGVAPSSASVAVEPATRGYDGEQLQRLLLRELPQSVVSGTPTIALATQPSAAKAWCTRQHQTSAPDPVSVWRRRSRVLVTASAALLGMGMFVLSWLGLRAPRTGHERARVAVTRPAPPATGPAALAPNREQTPRAAEPEPAARAHDADAPTRSDAPSQEHAASALANGRYVDALAAYRDLARTRPEQPVFAAIATILERRLAARCKQRLESGAMPCAEGSH